MSKSAREALGAVLPKIRLALGKKEFIIAEVSEVKEEEAEKGSTKLIITTRLEVTDEMEHVVKELQVEVYRVFPGGSAPTTVVLKKVTTLNTIVTPRSQQQAEVVFDQELGDSETTVALQADGTSLAELLAGTNPDDGGPSSDSDAGPLLLPQDRPYDPACPTDSDDVNEEEVEYSPLDTHVDSVPDQPSTSPTAAEISTDDIVSLVPIITDPVEGAPMVPSNASAIGPFSPALMALLASARSKESSGPAPPISPALLALLNRPSISGAPLCSTVVITSPRATLVDLAPSSSTSPRLGATTSAISAPLMQTLTSLCAIWRTHSPSAQARPTLESTLMEGARQKRKRHECGLEESVAKRLRITSGGHLCDNDAQVQTPYGPVGCGHLVDMVVATLSALDCTTPVSLQHRCCVHWTTKNHPHFTLHPVHLLAPAKTLSLREQLLLQRGCAPLTPPPSILKSPERTFVTPEPGGHPSDSPDLSHMEAPTPLQLTPPLQPHPPPIEDVPKTPERPPGSSTPADKKLRSPPQSWANPKSYHYQKATQSHPAPTAPPSNAPLSVLTAEKKNQMKALLSKKLAMLHATFQKYKDKSAELLKNPNTTAAQRQEIFRKLKETTDAIKQTLEQQKQVSQMVLGQVHKRIPGLSLADAEEVTKPIKKETPVLKEPQVIKPAVPAASTSSTHPPNGPSPPKSTLQGPTKEEVTKKVHTVVTEMQQAWDMDEDVLFK